MRRKTIVRKLRQKFDDWVESILDPEVREMVKKNSIITGGCIPSMLMGEDVNDYDIYFTDRETTLAVARYYTDKFNSGFDQPIRVLDGVHDINAIPDKDRIYLFIQSVGIARYTKSNVDTKNKVKYLPNIITCNAITLHDDIQLITRFYGSPEEIHENFDFAHCRCYWESKNDNLVLPSESLECILSKQLIYRGSKYPLSSVIRTRKFITRDWKITGGEYLKMCFQLSQLDLANIEILADQLIGVDTTYFLDVIDKLNEFITSHDGAKLETTHVIQIVDEVFN